MKIQIKQSITTLLAVLMSWVLPITTEADENDRLKLAIRMAEEALARLDDVEDYTAMLVKRERINGILGDYQFCSLKVRHAPFSVYMKFYKPQTVAGRETIYVEGQNNGKLLAHDPKYAAMGSISLAPDGLVAMNGQRYPITNVGIKKLLKLLIEKGQREQTANRDIQVVFRKGASVDDRMAEVIELRRSSKGDESDFYRVRIYIDRELRVPIRYDAHGWPASPNDEPPLIEEYTYRNLKLNVGLSDIAFDSNNPSYDFPRKGLIDSFFSRS